MARRRSVILTDAQRRFAAAEIAPMTAGIPACERCRGRGFVVTSTGDVDACQACTKRAESEWRKAYEQS